MPKVPVTFLGVETSEVPRVVSEQLGLPKGFGLVVDYVVPEGPAAAAGVQQSDIIKMLNDQILMEPEQLAKLVRSYTEGTNVTLTILRKGSEVKLTVKLAKHEVPSHENFFGPEFERHRHSGHENDFGMLNHDLQNMKFDFGDMSNIGPTIRDAVQDARREAIRAREEARRAARGIHVITTGNGSEMKSTTIDLGKAQIVFTDSQGEMRIEKTNGKKMLMAKDPQGRVLFSGPIDSKEELDKVPADVRQRYDQLEHKDLPAVAPGTFVEKEEDADNDNDADDNEGSDNDNESGAASTGMQQVSLQAFPRSLRTLNPVSI
jgi:hypothetical protein